jgi:hypothetical protein
MQVVASNHKKTGNDSAKNPKKPGHKPFVCERNARKEGYVP